MALDDLKETIETLQQRIQSHRVYLAGHETRTRQALIDPMLCVLGWDIENPDSVQLEATKTRREWIDYVLMGSQGSIAGIEAKALGKPLKDKATDQALSYATKGDIDYMVVTDGDHWQMLDVFKKIIKEGPLEERILMDFRLTRDDPYVCALQALRLWRPNLASGKPQEAATPVMMEKPASAESASTIPEPSSRHEVAKPSKNGDWKPLAELKVESRQKPPASIEFPNSSPIPNRSWKTLLETIAKHLVETGKLSARDCPVAKSKQRYLLHTEPIHLNGKEFHTKLKIGELWLEANFSAVEVHNIACWLLRKFGVDPSTVLVSTPQP